VQRRRVCIGGIPLESRVFISFLQKSGGTQAPRRAGMSIDGADVAAEEIKVTADNHKS